ncbi:hypothetical protein HY085_01900 [Candidatus Gottesmanbacteria bacterium]|nr:hypothetical protein [Candidatus Gottesmanbacteria bacterium]
MRILEVFLHFFTPRHTNNHKAKALHVSSIGVYITILLVVQIFLTSFARIKPGVLGYASNITVTDLLKDTNEKRVAAGDRQLVLNDQLSQAAAAKAKDMFAKQYWAHTAPDGVDPWSFILSSGYNYLFAGENLARDFGDSRSVVNAWINSPSHKENLLNPRYQEVGFAVVNGKYNGYETTLVVQMFGAKPGGILPTPAEPPKVQSVQVISNNIKLDVFKLTKNLSLGLIMVLVGVLVVDSFLIYKRKTVRLSGHNLAHLLFLLAVLVALNLIGRGLVL